MSLAPVTLRHHNDLICKHLAAFCNFHIKIMQNENCSPQQRVIWVPLMPSTLVSVRGRMVFEAPKLSDYI